MPDIEERSNSETKHCRLSEILMEHLLKEKLYVSAAELAFGSKLLFEMYTGQIEDAIADTKRWPSRRTFNGHVKPIMEKAYVEIGIECRWSQYVVSKLPETPPVVPIRKAFEDVAIARLQLFNKLLKVQEEYLLAEEEASVDSSNSSLAG